MTKNQTLTSDEIQLIQSLNLDPNSDNLKQQIQEILNPTVAAITDSQKPPLERGTEGGVSSWQQEQIYIIGNPPFVGSKLQSKEQRQEMAEIFRGVKGAGVMDYVSAWYIKAGQLQNLNPKIETAFVSTNSISQGEQVGILWGEMFKRFGVEIKFAHRTFAWSSEARGKAQVYVIIIGFSKPENIQEKLLFDYPNIKDEPIEIKAKNINPYLVVADNVTITKRSKPICNVPAMNFGNMPLDGGHLILSDEEKNQFILEEPNVEKFIKPLISAREFLNNGKRWCLWLVEANPTELKKMPKVLERVENVKKFREASVAPSTRKFAFTPTLFRDRNNPESFIVVPRVSSERRRYIPMGIFDKNSIVSDTCLSIPEGKLYHLGVLMSTMHMAWVKYTCGRLKSDFRYSKDIVYNNFPWSGVDGEILGKPELKNDKLKTKIEECAKEVLEARAKFENASLADLYDPLAMPPELTKAHQKLDKAVDEAYRKGGFKDDVERVEWLFEGYEVLSK